MKIFLSHATTDAELVRGLVELLQLGAGVPHGDIFCSSIRGTIPNGVYFVQHILRELMAADLIIAVLSPAYFESQFCLAEAGVAQVRQIAKTATSYSLLVPPTDFRDLDGVLHGVQSGRILETAALDELRDRVTRGASHAPSTAIWNSRREDFLRMSDAIIGQRLALRFARQLTVQDAYFERSVDPNITYKSKLRVALRNDSGREVQVRAPSWTTEIGDVPVQRPACSKLQVEAGGGSWQPEAAAAQLPVGRAVRVWIGLEPSFTDDDLRRRHETKRLGILSLPVRVDRFDVELKIRI